MKWSMYPEVNEAAFTENPLATLQDAFVRMTPMKARLREEMLEHQLGWIYGWGDPVRSNEFGRAPEYVWRTILDTLGLE